ncbi:IS66 family insertion sequence element accessory protein TnpB [Puniceicoccaceae bacterium K14]|nr:IS66 family insertion sequence element accessory protein TnpB [Puniceicoccaceae bacterium K14]
MSQIETDRCYVYSGVVDLRKGADSLKALLGKTEPGVLYLFSNRTRALLKFLSVDSTGVYCGTRRLHHCSFDWPESHLGKQKLTAEELSCLLAGGSLKKLRLKKLLTKRN